LAYNGNAKVQIRCFPTEWRATNAEAAAAEYLAAAWGVVDSIEWECSMNIPPFELVNRTDARTQSIVEQPPRRSKRTPAAAAFSAVSYALQIES
jgi:hypothetical protein